MVNSYYDGMNKGPDFSKYLTRRLPPQATWVDPNLQLEQQRNTGYGNYTPLQLNFNQTPTPQPSKETEGDEGKESWTKNINYAGAITNTLGLAATTGQIAQPRFQFSPLAPQQNDINTPPVYNAGQLQAQASNSHPQGAQSGEILSGAAQGAAAGTSIAPGIGTAIGAAVGGLSSIFGGEGRRSEEQRRKTAALEQVRQAQKDYNQSDVQYRQHQNQLYDYYNRNNTAGREYNIYKTRF